MGTIRDCDTTRLTAPSPQIRSLKALWPYFAKNRGAWLVVGACLLLEAAYEVFFRYSFRIVIDEGVQAGRHGLLLLLLSILIIGGAVCCATTILSDYLWARYGMSLINHLRRDIFEGLQNQPLAVAQRLRPGDLSSRIMADAERIREGFVSGLPMGMTGLLQLALSLILMAEINLWLSGIAIMGLVCSFGPSRLVNGRSLAASYAFRTCEGQLSAHLQENILAQPVVKAYGLERKAAADFRRELDSLLAQGARAYFLSYLSQRLPDSLFLVFQIIVFGMGASMVIGQTITLGELVAFQALFVGLSHSVHNVAWLGPCLVDAAANLNRVMEVTELASAAPMHPDRGGIDLPSLQRAIAFSAVTFVHPGRRRGVHGLSFEVQQGKFVAVVGGSGAGKSTLVRLLLRFMEPAGGSILIDDVDIRTASLCSLRRQIGLVQQDVILFAGSIRENIRYGALDASDREVEAAAWAAGLSPVIARLPDGFDTPCGDAGRLISGGERQRIALARALVRQPAILILDEATASLDTATEADILHTVRTLRGRCTILAITHRLAVSRTADLIFVLEDGTIADSGTHEELVARRGSYLNLWRHQAAETPMAARVAEHAEPSL